LIHQQCLIAYNPAGRLEVFFSSLCSLNSCVRLLCVLVLLLRACNNYLVVAFSTDFLIQDMLYMCGWIQISPTIPSASIDLVICIRVWRHRLLHLLASGISSLQVCPCLHLVICIEVLVFRGVSFACTYMLVGLKHPLGGEIKHNFSYYQSHDSLCKQCESIFTH
jgi:hypothetical protein